MPLTSERKKQLRSLGHGLKPVVTIADNGLSDAVVAELDRALKDHELIKVKLAVEDRQERVELSNLITKQCGATVVQQVGKILLLLKEAKKPNPKLSNLQRFKS